MKQKLKSKVWWPGITKDVDKITKHVMVVNLCHKAVTQNQLNQRNCQVAHGKI